MAILSIQEIKDAQDITETTIPVSEWGGEVIVRSVSKRQMKDLKNTCKNTDGELDDDKVEKALFIHGMINPVVSDEDYEWMQDKSASAMTKVLKAILGASNLEDTSVKEEEKKFRP